MRTLWLFALQLALLVFSVSAQQQVEARQISAVQQTHIAVGRNPGDVVITYLTVGPTVGSLPSVTYAVDGTPPGSWLSVTASAQAHSWNSWNGVVYVATLTGLQPATYTYQCTADGSTFSAIYNFTVHDWALPSDGSWTWGFTADMGSFPASQVVAARMTPLTSVEMWLLGGDLSYSAGYFGAQANQALNDAFWRMIEPYAANIPVMVTSGNHESYDNHYAAYLGRAGNSMPVDSPGMLYYSYDYRNVHFVALDSEGLDVQSSAQAQIDWINADLTAAIARRAAGAIDFIVCFLHYAPYSSVDPTRGHGSDYTLRAVLEPVLRPYDVDLVLAGHDHLYERTHPVYAAVPLATSNPVYTQGVAPIFVCAGTGGASFYAGWTMPQPDWSAQRALFHGYVLATMYGNGTMYFAALDDTGGRMDEFWLNPRVPTTPPATTVTPTTESPTSPPPIPTLPPATSAPTTAPTVAPTEAPTEAPTASPSSTSPVPSPTAEPTAPPVRISRATIFALAIVGASFVVLIGIVLPSVICFRLWRGQSSGQAQPQELQAVELISDNDDV